MRVLVSFAIVALAFVSPAFAADEAAHAAATGDWSAIAAGLGIALAAFGGAIGQGKAVASAVEGIGRNPAASGKIFLPMIIGLVLIESLVIYALVIAAKLVGLF